MRKQAKTNRTFGWINSSFDWEKVLFHALWISIELKDEQPNGTCFEKAE